MSHAAQLENGLWRDALQLIFNSQSLPQGLEGLAAILVRRFEVDFCAIYLLDRSTDELVLRGASGQRHRAPERFFVAQGITGMAAFQGRPLQVARMARDPRSVRHQERDYAYKSIIAVPIDDGEHLLGAFNLQSRAVRHFSASEVEVLGGMVQQLILGIVRTTRIFENMQRRTDELQALNELGQAMNLGLGLDESLELIAAHAAEALSARGSAIRLVVEDGTLALATMVSTAEKSVDSEDEKRIAEYVAATGEPMVIDDLRAVCQARAPGTSLVCLPLLLEERVVGTLTLFDKMAPVGMQRCLFSIDDLDMLFALSSQIAAEIEDIRLTGRLQGLVRSGKQQAAELRILYDRSRVLLESISDGLLAVDDRGLISEANTVARQILGAGEAALLERDIDGWIEDKPPLKERLQRGEQFSNRVITLKTAAGPAAAMASMQPILDQNGRVAGAVLTFREMGEVGRLVRRVIGVQRTFSFDDIIGGSLVVEKTKELARIAAGTSSNILIQGETGTGKEVFAQAIHHASPFSEGPFLAVNCAALPRDLIESELFGYVEGAFTGASKKGRLGRFELASGGTLFLDEIGEMPPEVQVKLLRVLQEKAIVRVGGDRTIPINCRLIAATNRDLHRAVAAEQFRQDLLYRLNVITIELPPLRERSADIPLFVDKFLHAFAERNGKVVEGLAARALDTLLNYRWPGNVRELENAIEHAVALARGRTIQWEDLPAHLREVVADVGRAAEEEGGSAFELARRGYEKSVRQLYLEALRSGRGDILRAARLLGMSRATFYRRLREYGLKAEAARMRFEYRTM